MLGTDAESYSSSERYPAKFFGIAFSACLLGLGLLPLAGGEPVRAWLIAAGTAASALTLFWPRVFAPIGRLWLTTGELIGHVVSRFVLSIVYFLVVTPTGIMIRLSGIDPMRLRLDASAKTYWIDCDDPGLPPESFLRQY